MRAFMRRIMKTERKTALDVEALLAEASYRQLPSRVEEHEWQLASGLLSAMDTAKVVLDTIANVQRTWRARTHEWQLTLGWLSTMDNVKVMVSTISYAASTASS